MSVFLLVLVLLVSVAVAAFCAGAETGFLSVRRERILHMAREGGRLAKVVQGAIADLGRTTTALLVGNNLAGVSYSSASAALSVTLFPEYGLAQTAWALAAALVMLIVGEFLPKLLCAARPLRRTLLLAPYWLFFAKVFVPVGSVVMAVIGKFLPKRESRPKLTPETLLKILEDRKDGVKLSDIESALIGRIMVLRSRNEFVTPDSVLTVLDEPGDRAD